MQNQDRIKALLQDMTLEEKVSILAGASMWYTPLQQLVADENAQVVLEQHFPGMLDNPQLQMAMGMSLKQIAPFAPDAMTEEKLQAVAADLARLG